MLSDKMRAYREAAEPPVSQAELASRIGVSRQALWNWENGFNIPSLPNLRAWGAALHLTTAEVAEVVTEAITLPLPEPDPEAAAS